MAFKIKHITTRFLLQSILTILIISTLIFIMFYSGYRKKDTLKAITSIEIIHSKLVESNINIDNAFNLQKTDPDFVNKSCDLLISDQKLIINQITDSIAKLKSLKYLNSLFNHEKIDDSLIVVLNEYYILFSKTLLSLKEKGNYNGGLINLAVENVKQVSEELTLAPDNGLQAANFKAYTSAYVVNFSYQKLSDLVRFCDEIVTPFNFIEDYDASSLESKVISLKEKLLYIQKVDLRIIDENNSTGQLLDLNNTYKNLIIQYESFKNEIKNTTDSYITFWNWIFTIFAVLLTLAYTIIMWQFSHVVHNSVKSLHKITISLSNGNILDTVPKDGSYEFNAFNKDLKSLFTLLNKRKVFIDQLLNEKFDSELEIKGENDEIGNSLIKLQSKLLLAQEKQTSFNKENSIRQYINEGLAKFAEVMRITSNDINLLADSSIKELVKYLDALQGSIFINKENNLEEFHLMATFAFDRKRFKQKTIMQGEGLIGTCAAEKKTINITELPENYIAIRSGLGDTSPNNILVLPVMNEEELVGVIEIASLKTFNEVQIELAENIASSFASTIIATRINSKTAQLLKRSQEQAAEVAEQEEEMRQNMEELKATQEESSRKEEEMKGLLDAIEKNFYVLEYDFSANIIHINNRLLKFLEQTVDHVMHKKHHDLFSTESMLSESFIKKIFKNKKTDMLEETLNWGDKKYKYKYFLSPVFANNGDVIKVLNLFSIDED